MSSLGFPERVEDSEEAGDEDRARRRGHPPVEPILSKLGLMPSSNSQPLPQNSHLNAHDSRPMSPTIFSLRFGAHNGSRTSRWSSESGANKARRASVQSIPTDKGKGSASAREREDYTQPVRTGHNSDRDSMASPSTGASSFRTSSRPSTSPGSLPPSKKPARGGIFMAASDALGLKKFGRRKPPVRQTPAPVVFPDIIEITARKRDEEEEERCRLRAEAARAIGLDPSLVNLDTQSRHNTTDEDEDEDGQEQRESSNVHDLTSSQHHGDNMRHNSTYTPHTSVQVHGSTTSVAGTTPPLPMTIGRYRSGSLMGHSRTNSANLTPIPAYPSTISSLTQWQQYSGTLPKYYQSTSLRMFALSSSKNWKTRYIVLTSPTAIISRTLTPAVSYLHLFKGSGPAEKELERLEINEDSVVFVSDDEIGGRRHVVKVGGIEVGAFKKELNHDESGRSMWFLQMEDSHQWISAIKNSILNQRAIRAGLLPAAATSFGVNEPRGDIDVMLSMRAQGFITASSPPVGRQHFSTPPSTVAQAEKNYASSISEYSVQSHASSPKVATTVSALKSLFSGSRPRSGSRATSIDTTRQLQYDPNGGEDVFSGTGNSLMSILRATTPDVQSQSSGATIVRTSSPFMPSVTPEIGIDRKIIPDRQSLQFVASDLPTSSTASRGTKALSLGSMSLQPPPRKRGVPCLVTPTVTLTSIQPTPEMYQNAQYNGTTGSLGALTFYKDHPEPASPTHTAGSATGTLDNHRRPASVQSVSTYGSNENSLSIDRSSTTSTKRTSSSMKRWSRPGSLPPRTSPPTGPPPNVPGSNSRQLFPGDTNSSRSRSRPSSAISTHSQQSIVSSLPSFSKRTSVSSVGTSSSNSHSPTGQVVGRPGIGSHRASMPPPPRPAPTFALPPAPGDRDRALSVDSLPTARSSPKTKRASIAGRGFKLSMIAPSKPPPSNNLPPRPDEVEEHERTSGSRLSTLNPIPASPDPGAAPFPPPRGPLPPTPTPAEGTTNTSNRHSTSVSRHTSLRERLRILSTPSSPPSTNSATSTSSNHTPTPTSSNTNTNIDSDDTTHTPTHTNARSNPSFTPRFSGSGFHHGRSSSTSSSGGNSSSAGVSFLSLTGNPNKQQNSRKSVPPPLASTPSYVNMTNTHSQPATPIGEKIMSFETESSFLNFTPISPSVPLPPLSPHTSMSTPMNMPMHLRPLPAVPVAIATEITSLSPPPRRNSKQLNFERPPSPPRTPSTPSIFDDKSAESRHEPESGSARQPIVFTNSFGSSTFPSNPPKLPLLVSLPPSPSLQPTSEERSATSLDSLSYETHRMTPSPPASIISPSMSL